MFHLLVLTPEKLIFEGLVKSLIVPGSLGYLEILTNHASIITPLKPGKLSITVEKKEVFAISGGILECSKNKAILLADAVESP